MQLAAVELGKESHVNSKDVMTGLHGRVVKVDTVAPPIGTLWDIATLDTTGRTNLKWARLFIQNAPGAASGSWTETTVKLEGAAALKIGEQKIRLATGAADLTIDASAKTCSITIGSSGALTCADAPPASGRRLSGAFGMG